MYPFQMAPWANTFLNETYKNSLHIILKSPSVSSSFYEAGRLYLGPSIARPFKECVTIYVNLNRYNIILSCNGCKGNHFQK